MLRVASYNIQKCIGLDGRRRPRRILEVLAELDADIVALQEADLRFGRRRAALPREMIAARTPYQVAPVAARHASLGWHGNAILVRRPHRVLETARIHLPIVEPRGAVTAVIEVMGREIRIVATHLSLLRRTRQRQIAVLAERLAELADGGADRGARRLQRVAPAGRNAGPAAAGLRGSRPGAKLSRAAAARRPRPHRRRAGLRLAAAGVHASRLARVASDHLPVWAELDPVPEPAAPSGRRPHFPCSGR